MPLLQWQRPRKAQWLLFAQATGHSDIEVLHRLQAVSCESKIIASLNTVISFCRRISKLVGALSPVNHKGLHQGWTQTSFCLKVVHFKSHDTTSDFLLLFVLAYLYSTGTQHGNLHAPGWPILFCGPTQEPVVVAANTGKLGRGFGKNAGEWTGMVETSKEEIPGSKRSMYS